MVPIKCDVPNCFEMPKASFKVNNTKLYRCDQHIIKCNIGECTKIPVISFKHKNDKIYYCKTHGRKYQIYVCKRCNCNAIATYGQKGSKVPTLCVKHKRPSMNVVINRCSHFSCYNKPTHNYIVRFKETNEPRGIYCELHKKNKMISIEEYNSGYCTKTYDLEQNNIEVDITAHNPNDIILGEQTPFDNTIENKNDDNNDDNEETISVIYDMKKDNDIYMNCLMNEYDIVEININDDNEINEDDENNVDDSYEMI